VYYGFDIFGIRLPWPTTQLYYDCKDEMAKQLDILYLFKRITVLERGMGSLLTERQIMALRLMDTKTLNEAKKDRRRSKWNEEVFLKRAGRFKCIEEQS
jgi:hypothetical protein